MTVAGPAAASESHDALTQKAAEFFERERFGAWSDGDRAELDAWLAQSVLHEVAYLRLKGHAARAEKLAALRPDRPGRGAQIGIATILRRPFVPPLLAAAVVALFAVLAFPFVKALLEPADRVDSTDVGGRTLLSFSDHTLIELDTDTLVRLRMTTAERTVWLEKGEAWFHVAHDAAHPFTVIVGKHRITDLGTEFLVRREADDVDVALLNGRASLNAGGVQTAMLDPGDEAVATSVSLSVIRKTPQELADELAWRRGMLVFRQTRLADAVSEINRYSRVKLVIADPAIDGMRIGGAFRTDSLDGFLDAMQTVLKLHVARDGGDILLSAGARAKRRASSL